MKLVQVTCARCGGSVSKRSNEYNRRLRLGKSEFFCNKSCANSVTSRRMKRKTGEMPAHLRPDNRLNELSPFRWFIRRVESRRARKGPTDLTSGWLKSLWDEQGGICPLTGWLLILPATSEDFSEGYSPRNASLDRIDESSGYVMGNVRFVSVMANLARARCSDAQLVEFCRAVATHHETREADATPQRAAPRRSANGRLAS